MLAILFEMDGRIWGADARLVETVVPAIKLRTVQGAPKWIAGVFNLRGLIVPAIDLSEIVCARKSESIFSTRYMIVKIAHKGKEALIALIAERVTSVVEIDESEISPAEGDSYGGGIFSADGKLAQIVRIDKLITGPETEEIFKRFF